MNLRLSTATVLGLGLLTLLAPRAHAQSDPYLDFGTYASGGIITVGSPEYDSQTETYRVGLLLHGVDSQSILDYYVEINGVLASLSMGAVASQPVGIAVARIPVRPIADVSNVLLPITADLRLGLGDALLDRQKIVMYDLRADPLATPSYSGVLPAELAVQLSHTAVDKLSPVHTSSMPSQGKEQFEQQVLGAVEALGTLLDDGFPATYEKESVNPDRLCVDLEDYPEFLTSGTYLATYAEALVAYGVHLAFKNAFPLAPSPFCVRDVPLPKHFTACFTTIEVPTPSFSPPEIGDIELSLGATPNDLFASEINIGPMSATTDVVLRGDVKIYYDENACPALARPTGTVSETELASNAALDAWRTCPGVALNLDGATVMGDGPLFTYGAAAYPERVAVLQDTSASFALGATTIDAAKGVCADNAALQHEVSGLAAVYFDAIKTGLEDAWDDADQAGALERLLSAIESGAHALHPEGYALDHSFADLTHDVDIDGDGTVEPGILGVLDVSIAPLAGAGASYFYSAPRAPVPMALSSDANNFFQSDTFDVAYTLTTGALNQIASPVGFDRLVAPVALSWAEIGLDPLLFNADPGEPVPLEATILSAYDPAFAVLPPEVHIAVSPSLQPFVWMHPDPQPQPPSGRHPMSYEAGDLRITISSVDANGDVGEPLFLFSVDVIDPDFQVQLGQQPAPGDRFLEGAWSSKEPAAVLMLESADPACWDNPCARSMEDAVLALLGTHIKDRMLAVIGEFPAPSHWDAEGTATQAIEVQQNELYRQGNILTLYGEMR